MQPAALGLTCKEASRFDVIMFKTVRYSGYDGNQCCLNGCGFEESIWQEMGQYEFEPPRVTIFTVTIKATYISLFVSSRITRRHAASFPTTPSFTKCTG